MKASTVARETNLPYRWVQRAAKRQAKVRHGEDDPCAVDPCPWCDALRWILSNAEQVRTDEAAAERRARLKQEHARTMASVRWKRENHDLLEFLEGMVAGDFRNAALRAVEGGKMTVAMESAVRDAARRRPVPPPPQGTWVDVVATVEEAVEMVDKWGRSTLRVGFVSDDGWRGRVETIDPSQLRVWKGAKAGTTFAVRGRVVWRADRLAIVDPVGALTPIQRKEA